MTILSWKYMNLLLSPKVLNTKTNDFSESHCLFPDGKCRTWNVWPAEAPSYGIRPF